ncbi:uncharacterized protein LOC122306343 [Carya illinoinensis]|uniref:uncharacterized protein LOC122306343 n=1 Tax=Carya illinoinensis TaxID=32201 RepID=UPI001C719D0D|nr:uncharacterized protein LOC122306343 [Carya illinoinensis]
MTVEQYAQKFMELNRFATHLIAIEEMQAEHFQEGLRHDIRKLAPLLVRRDGVLLVKGVAPGQKRRSFAGEGSGLPFGVRMGCRVPVCGRCNRAHEGECLQSGGTQCYCCVQEGHFARECPIQRQVVQARVYAVTPGEVDDEAPETQDGGVITGRVHLYDFYAYTLFVLGASQSFVSATFSPMCNLVTEPLSQSLVVTLPNGDIVWCSKVTLGYPFDFGGRTLDADLVVFKLLSRVISFQLLEGDYLEFVGSKLKERSVVISAIQVKRDIACGADAFLVQVLSTPSEKKSLVDIPIMEEFFNVFVDDLLGLPPVRELEFAIDLDPGAFPMHKAPYHMAPAELK